MKKNLFIFILSIISIASLIFGYTQKQKADEQKVIAKELSEANRELRRQAELEQKTRQELSKKTQQELQRMRKEAKLAQENK